ncbi:hypothetical protein GE21DRAFT_1128701 [Neurospora crassa]|nr:hypothetical protein GE21DRAFT_1128701 [Neurospora crassa]
MYKYIRPAGITLATALTGLAPGESAGADEEKMGAGNGTDWWGIGEGSGKNGVFVGQKAHSPAVAHTGSASEHSGRSFSTESSLARRLLQTISILASYSPASAVLARNCRPAVSVRIVIRPSGSSGWSSVDFVLAIEPDVTYIRSRAPDRRLQTFFSSIQSNIRHGTLDQGVKKGFQGRKELRCRRKP